jgi:hypothetical protein
MGWLICHYFPPSTTNHKIIPGKYESMFGKQQEQSWMVDRP